MPVVGGAGPTGARVEETLKGIMSGKSRLDYVRPIRPWKPHPMIAPLNSDEEAVHQLIRRRNKGRGERRYAGMDLLPKTMKIVQDHGMYEWFCRSRKYRLVVKLETSIVYPRFPNMQSILHVLYRSARRLCL